MTSHDTFPERTVTSVVPASWLLRRELDVRVNGGAQQ